MTALAACLVGAVVLLGSTLPAQPREDAPRTGAYSRQLIDRRDGLPESQVNSIARSSDGYYWLGTRRGLVRYDGVTFTLYEPRNTPTLPAPWINHVRVDKADRLWLSTASGLAVREGASVVRVDTLQIPAVDVWSSFEDRHGSIWVATEAGVYVGDGRRFRAVRSGFVYEVAEDARGRIWIAGRGILGYLSGDSLVNVGARLGIRGRAFAILMAEPDRIWVGTQRGAIEIRLDTAGVPRLGRVVSTANERERPVWALARSSDGAIWLGTEMAGTLLFDGERLHAMSDAAQETWTVFPDTHGAVWAGTGSGLERYQRTAFTTMRRGLPDSPVWATRLDATGTLWAALGDGSVHHWNGIQFTRSLGGPDETYSVPMAADGDGIVVAEGSKTLLRVDATGRRQAIPWTGPPVGTMLGLLRVDSALWISADSGLFRLTGGRLTSMNDALGLREGARPREIARDSSGRLYFGRPWLTVVDGTRRRRYDARDGLTSSNVRALLTRGAFTWIGTADSGLYVLHRDTIRALGALDPWLKREVLGIGADDHGYLWLSWTYGIVRISLRDLEAAVTQRQTRVSIRSFDQSDGLPVGSFRGDFQSRFAKDRAGALYVPNASGVIRIDPLGVSSDTVAPPVVIESIEVDGRPLAPQSALRLAPGVERVEFTVSTPGALRPRGVRLQYRMVGVDTAWIDAGMRRLLSFGPLSGGRYQFETRTATEEGNWGDVRTTVSIDVRRQLVEQRWFLPLLLLLTGSGVLWVTRARRVALELRSRQLAADVAERTAELEAERRSLERRVAERTQQLAAELAERERLQRALVEAQKLEGLGRLAGGVAHEINNSMTSVLGFAELASASAADQPAVLTDLDEIKRAGERVTAIVRQLLQFARRQQTERVPVDAGECLQHMTRSLGSLVGPNIRLDLDIEAALPLINADRGQLEQVIVNLVVNARDAMPTGGTVWMRVGHRQLAKPLTVGGVMLEAGDYVWLSVRDNGRGITADVRERLFEPFFTTKDVSAGTGLGLAVSHGIVREHGGAITVTSAAGEGALFEIWLPAAAATDVAHVSPSTASGEPVAHVGATVLLVDDDGGIREILRRHLAQAGYQVLVAKSGHEALAIAADADTPIDLVISDVRMPDLDGLAFARALHKQQGAQKMMFLTGSAGYEPLVDSALESFGPILAKPVSRERLQTVVRQLLADDTSPVP